MRAMLWWMGGFVGGAGEEEDDLRVGLGREIPEAMLLLLLVVVAVVDDDEEEEEGR